MITISERESKKISGDFSLFANFEYKPEIIEAIKKVGYGVYDKKNKEWEFPVFALSNLINRLSQIDQLSVNLIDHEIESEGLVTSILSSSQFKTTPFDYQLEGIEFGLNNNDWLLLDDPGLGKTLQLIYTAEQLKQQKGIKHCLIICGIATLKKNWVREISKHSELSSRILGQKVNKKGRLVVGSVPDRVKDIESNPEEFFWITNIETLRDDNVIKALKKINPEMTVVDEIHVCKSPTSIQGKNLLKFKDSEYKIGATGTLLLSKPLDCYVPLKWIGKEKSNYSTFKGQYVKYGGVMNNEILGYQNLEFLHDIIDECSLRRTKDILELPPKNIINEFIEITDDERRLYDEVRMGIANEADKVKISSFNALSSLVRLGQTLSCPSILTSNSAIKSSKAQRAIQLAEEVLSNNEKVVIFTGYKQTVKDIVSELAEYNPLEITGDIAEDVISNNIELFQEDDEHKVIVCTWQKAGTGITLNRARYSIFVDCSWVPALNRQAEDRIYRIGTNLPVFVYYLWAEDSVDERKKQIVEDKSLLNEYVIDQTVTPLLYNRLKELVFDLTS